jgi:hypothetical protein
MLVRCCADVGGLRDVGLQLLLAEGLRHVKLFPLLLCVHVVAPLELDWVQRNWPDVLKLLVL